MISGETEIGNMAKVELVRALKELMRRGIWETKDDLMKEVIQIRPSTFGQLTDNDAFRILNRGNDIALNCGKLPAYLAVSPISNDEELNRKESIGRCIDLWKDDSVPENKKFGYHSITINTTQPKPIEHEPYYRNTFKIDISLPHYEKSFHAPVEEYPREIAKTVVKIETIGSTETEDIEF